MVLSIVTLHPVVVVPVFHETHMVRRVETNETEDTR